jgi:hypothetical protein
MAGLQICLLTTAWMLLCVTESAYLSSVLSWPPHVPRPKPPPPPPSLPAPSAALLGLSPWEHINQELSGKDATVAFHAEEDVDGGSGSGGGGGGREEEEEEVEVRDERKDQKEEEKKKGEHLLQVCDGCQALGVAQ